MTFKEFRHLYLPWLLEKLFYRFLWYPHVWLSKLCLWETSDEAVEGARRHSEGWRKRDQARRRRWGRPVKPSRVF